ncbi:MAG TPA: helix-turn-helix transcriptional regulator [Planctomycetota bacterium]|nr:helix-turn-helix transcriptional regulator [Planctomycetota bacterium]
MSVQTLTLNGRRYAVIEAEEYDRLRALAGTEDHELPPLPGPNRSGNYPALEYTTALLARKIVRERRAAGLTQADLARRAGIRPETLNRIERGKAAPKIATVDRLANAIEQAKAEADATTG